LKTKECHFPASERTHRDPAGGAIQNRIMYDDALKQDPGPNTPGINMSKTKVPAKRTQEVVENKGLGFSKSEWQFGTNYL